MRLSGPLLHRQPEPLSLSNDLIYGVLAIVVGLAPLGYVVFRFLRAAYRYDPQDRRRAGDLAAGYYRLIVGGLVLAMWGLTLIT